MQKPKPGSKMPSKITPRYTSAKPAKPTPKPKPKANPYLDAISAAQKKQNDALMKMWAKDKKRKKAKIRTK